MCWFAALLYRNNRLIRLDSSWMPRRSQSARGAGCRISSLGMEQGAAGVYRLGRRGHSLGMVSTTSQMFARPRHSSGLRISSTRETEEGKKKAHTRSHQGGASSTWGTKSQVIATAGHTLNHGRPEHKNLHTPRWRSREASANGWKK